jgi:hypothetical protein
MKDSFVVLAIIGIGIARLPLEVPLLGIESHETKAGEKPFWVKQIELSLEITSDIEANSFTTSRLDDALREILLLNLIRSS